MSDRNIKITYEIVHPCEGDDEYPEVEGGFECEDGVSMEPSDRDVEFGVTAVDKAVQFLKYERAVCTSGSPWSVGDWYSTASEQNYSTGETQTRSFFLDGFSPEEEQAVYRGVFPGQAARDDVQHQRWRAEDQERQRQGQLRRRRLAAARPHGVCEYAGRCVEHERDASVESCK